MDSLDEIAWLLEAGPECRPDEVGMASVERLIAASLDHLACVSGALVLRNGRNVCVRARSAGSLGDNLSGVRRLEEALIAAIGSGNPADLERRLPCAPPQMTCKGITVPVMGRAGEPLGALFFIRGPGLPHFERGHLSVAQLLSRQVARALEPLGIDASFVADRLTNQQPAATIHAVVTLAQDLRIETVEEYAETAGLVARLRGLRAR